VSAPKPTGAASRGAASLSIRRSWPAIETRQLVTGIRRETRGCACHGTGVVYKASAGGAFIYPAICPCRYMTADQTDAMFGNRGIVMAYERDLEAEDDGKPRPSLWQRLTRAFR